MGLLRLLSGALRWILASVLGLVGVLLCVTIILLPVGIPVVKIAGSLLVRSVGLMLPRKLVHPVDSVTRAAKKKARTVGSTVSENAHDAAKKGRKFAHKQHKRLA
jgi:hypothetical protein